MRFQGISKENLKASEKFKVSVITYREERNSKLLRTSNQVLVLLKRLPEHKQGLKSFTNFGNSKQQLTSAIPPNDVRGVLEVMCVRTLSEY